MLRLQKFLAEAGLASRRAAEQLIVDGRVQVNGQPVRQLGTKVDPEHDLVSLDGSPVRVKRKVHLAMNKPRDYLCTKADPEGRRTIMDLLPPDWRNVYPVGRLDRESEGLIFMTNDGDFALRLTHPRYGVKKRYVATVEGKVLPQTASKLAVGVAHEGETLKAERVRLISANNSHSVLELELAEGRNREVRRMLEAVGFEVVKLQRVQIGKITLGELRVGKWRTLTDTEIKTLITPL
ncbi:MAG: rRNA pseudouridine synthase [Verrucomicrobia bacterium]|nr:rRNA pseudouridine synthase [Verrucomicrobiota bacterium]